MQRYAFVPLVALAAAVPQTLPAGLNLPAGIDSVPSCAITPLLGLFTSSGCADVEASCLCPATDLNALTDEVNSACTSASDQDAANSWVDGFCSAYISSSSSAAPAATPTPSTTGTAEAPAYTTTDTTAAPVTTASGTGSLCPSNSSSNPTYTSSTPTPSTEPSTGAGNALRVSSMAALVVAIGGLTWVFEQL